MTDASSNPPALTLSGIAKHYRLYRKPMYRVLDLLGVCPPGEAFYSEHPALDGIDLSINNGEKVGIIGRNGAGKSTLLKIITQVIRPTAGTMNVRGKISALLQIGTGFHPDFTGRQNAYSAMAHQGITGRQADRKFDEVLEFSELDEFIDQPMKTYSTGMCARLMFSSAIVLEPDILVVDEVLGVGDAYFTHKSFNRMRDLCKGHGTTLLLVTHDIYSAMNLCDRFIWIDRGKVMFDGDAKTAIARYEASIKQQEEDRLRKRNVAAFERQSRQTDRLTVSVRSRNGFALPSPLAIDHIELLFDDGQRSMLQTAGGSPDWSLLPDGNLGDIEVVDGVSCRQLVANGSIFHKAEWSVAIPPDATLKQAAIRWNYAGRDAAQVRVFTDPAHVLASAELCESQGWCQTILSAGSQANDGEQTQYGTGMVRIEDAKFLDRFGQPVVKLTRGEQLNVRMRLKVDRDRFKEDAVTCFVGFNRPGVPYGGYAQRDRLHLPHDQDEVIVGVTLDPLLFGSGQWLVTLGVGQADLYESDSLRYFTLDPHWHHFIARGFELEVQSSAKVDTTGCFFMHPAQWRVETDAHAPIAAQSPALISSDA